MTLPTSAGKLRRDKRRLLGGPPEGLADSPIIGMDINDLDPDYYSSTRSSPGGRIKKRKNVPSRSVSPTSQAAGILFRMSRPGSGLESICVGDVRVASGVSLAGQPLPPPSKDYGFSYASRVERLRTDEVPPSKPTPTYAPDSPDGAADEDYDAGERVPTPSSSGRGRGRKTGHPPAPRMCISCGATKTPYWREAWSSTVLLCNACGLRFSKFRRRCLDCSYVPRKEDKGSKACTKCGGPWS